MEICNENIKYLKLLALQYPTIAEASTEIINLEAIVNLPKGIDISYSREVVEELDRKNVDDTDVGNELKNQIKDLKLLLRAYRKGCINESI